MNKGNCLVLFFLLIGMISFAQREKGKLDATWNSGGIVETFPLKKGETSGDYYLNEHWYEGDIIMNSNKIVSSKPLKIDLQNSAVEVKFDNEVRFMYLKELDTISWFNAVSAKQNIFVNSRKYGVVNPPIVEVLFDSEEMKLLAHTKTTLIKANYNAALDVGEKSDKIIKERTVYFTKSNNEIDELPKSKKSFLAIFDDHSNRAKDLIKSKNLDFKNEEDLITLLDLIYN